MTDEIFRDLRAAYLVGEEIVIDDLPSNASEVIVRTALGVTFEATTLGGSARLRGLPVGTHAVEARSINGALLGEEFVGVRVCRGDDPIMGFATSFDSETLVPVLTWLRQLRVTVVQIYDWMESYSAPLAEQDSYHDPLGRPISRAALKQLIEGVRENGAVAQAYAPVCATDNEFGATHSEWLLYRNDGSRQSLGNLLQIMDPGSREWQQHWIEGYGRAIDVLGFDGLHLDTYGYPRNALDISGQPVCVERGYAQFLDALRAARRSEVVSFNQVNGVPRGFSPPSPPAFRYSEVWPPNDRWRHLEGLLQRSAGSNPVHGDTLAIYPPVWQRPRSSALRTAVLSEAIVTALGANTLLWGDNYGVLCRPYYVEHEQLLEEEISTALEWHRFGLRCRDLFRQGVDTSWYELTDENASVVVSWAGDTTPEPVERALFARVRRDEELVVVSLLDLSGSSDGSWLSGTDAGNCDQAEVSILLDVPERWVAQAAVLGRNEGRFAPLEVGVTSHREGRALTCTVPVSGGWSVLRLQPRVSG
jgi:dextranase